MRGFREGTRGKRHEDKEGKGTSLMRGNRDGKRGNKGLLRGKGEGERTCRCTREGKVRDWKFQYEGKGKDGK